MSESNGRGRPPGVKNGEGTTPPVEIKKWTPKHQEVVDFHIMGKGRNEISRLTGYTEQHVGNIINSSHGKQLIQEHLDRMKELMEHDIEHRMVKLAEQSVERLGETLDIQFVPGTDAKKHQDNVALQLTKGYRGGRGDSEVGDERVLTHGLAKELVSALKKANDAEERLKDMESKEIVV